MNFLSAPPHCRATHDLSGLFSTTASVKNENLRTENTTRLLCRTEKFTSWIGLCTDKKENEIFLIYTEVQRGSVAKSYMRKGFPIYEDMRKYLTIYEEAVSLV